MACDTRGGADGAGTVGGDVYEIQKAVSLLREAERMRKIYDGSRGDPALEEGTEGAHTRRIQPTGADCAPSGTPDGGVVWRVPLV